jgi:hypothetical protein
MEIARAGATQYGLTPSKSLVMPKIITAEIGKLLKNTLPSRERFWCQGSFEACDEGQIEKLLQYGAVWR